MKLIPRIRIIPVLMLIGVFSSTGLADAVTETGPITIDPHMLSDMFVGIAEIVGPSVVTINSQTTVTTVMPSFPDFSGPFMMNPWNDFFSPPREQEFTMTGVGSGVILSADGLILTNHHVVGEADMVEVVLQNGDRYPGELVGTDPETDLAVVRIDALDLPVITIGNSDELKVGQWVLAIGSPFALSQTVTQGIVSYIGRSNVGIADYENYIQTDAAINPGNSGGALVDLDGRLIGINTAIATRTGSYQGIGFAIPVNSAVDVMEDLVSHGYVRRGWLGVSIQELTPGLAEHFGIDGSIYGVLVSQVISDTPAGEFGIQRGDVIFSIDGEVFQTLMEFRNLIASREPDSVVDIGIFREGRDRIIEVVLGEREIKVPTYSPPSVSEEYGWILEELDRETARSLGDEILQGVLVLDVHQSGRAGCAGIQIRDVILEIDGNKVRTPEDVNRLINASSDPLFLIWRQGNPMYYMM